MTLFKELRTKPSTFLSYDGLIQKYLSGQEMTEDDILALLEDCMTVNNYLSKYLRSFGVMYVYDRDSPVQFALAKVDGDEQ